MDTIGTSRNKCYIDDILVTGPTEEELLQMLEEVLCCLQKYGVRLKRSKCSFMQDAVEYLGHIVDAATPKKVAAIEKAPQPQNVEIFS